ncbi:hypothetical protein, partial [Pseudomonas fluorescens]
HVLTADGALVSSAEAANGLANKPVLRSWLTGLANNAQFSVTAEVDFYGRRDKSKVINFSNTTYTIKPEGKLSEDFETANYHDLFYTGVPVQFPALTLLFLRGRGYISRAYPEYHHPYLTNLYVITSQFTELKITLETAARSLKFGIGINSDESARVDYWGDTGYIGSNYYYRANGHWQWVNFTAPTGNITELKITINNGSVNLDNFTFTY